MHHYFQHTTGKPNEVKNALLYDKSLKFVISPLWPIIHSSLLGCNNKCGVCRCTRACLCVCAKTRANISSTDSFQWYRTIQL